MSPFGGLLALSLPRSPSRSSATAAAVAAASADNAALVGLAFPSPDRGAQNENSVAVEREGH